MQAVHREKQAWTSRESTALVGIVLIFGGFAAMGWWLAAAGAQAFGQSIGPGIAALLLFACGGVLTGKAAKKRGGLMQWQPSRAEVQHYRAEYRGSQQFRN